MSLRSVADQLDWDKARLSRIETGQQNITVEDVAQLITIYGVVDERRERLLDAARTADEPGWWEKLGLTQESATLADYEREASSAFEWTPLLIPGRLQVMDYAATFMEILGIETDNIARLIAARRERQRALAEKHTPYDAYIGEAALRVAVGGPRVMASQLRALLEPPDSVTVRVVPSASMAHLGQLGGFLLLRFPAAPVVVHVELLRSGVFHDDRELTDRYETAATQISRVAMSETQSARLIEKARKETEG